MWLTRLSITRPVTILMLVITLVILGLTSNSRLPVDLYPNVELPMLFISTVYPGTGPEEIETLVTKPIEDQLSTISGLKKLTSTSSEGVSQVSMEFVLGTSLNDAAADVRSKIDALRNQLPQDAKAPIVVKVDIGALPVITLNIASKSRSSIEVRRLADDVLKDRLNQVPGVAAVSVNGGDVREIRVEVDKNRLLAYNVSINQVVSALQTENLNVPSGTVEEKLRNFSVRVKGEFTDPQQIYQIRIPTGGTTPNLTIKDVATVRDTVQEPSVYTRLNGGNSVTLTIQKQSDANTVKVVDGVRAQLETLTGKPFLASHVAHMKPGEKLNMATAPVLADDVEITPSNDQSIFIKQALDDVYKSLFEGALLAVLIVFLFLHSLRGTFIIALAIPTSMIATFMVMDALGFSVNMMSMLGLSLSVGILVDDSIVVLENIHRHLRMGKPPKQAAQDGRNEIGLAAMTITLVDVVVFLPIAFMGGIVGQFFRQFGIVVAAAALFSLFISFTLTPMLASRWLKKHEEEEAVEAAQQEHPGLFRRFTKAWETGYQALETTYQNILVWTLEHRGASICVGLMVLAASVMTTIPKSLKSIAIAIGIMVLFLVLGAMLSGRHKINGVLQFGATIKPLFVLLCVLTLFLVLVPTKFSFEFAPAVDQRQLTIKIEEPVGTTLDETDRTTRMLETALNNKTDYPEVKTLTTLVGGNSGGAMSAGSTGADIASVSVELLDKTEFHNQVHGKPFRTTSQVIDTLNKQFGNLPGVKITASVSGGGPGGGSPVTIVVSGDDMARTRDMANQILDIVKNTPGTYSSELSWRDGRPELQALIDRDRAAQYGLSVAQIASALRTSMEGDTSSKYRENGKEYDIRVSLPQEQRNMIDLVPSMVVGISPVGQPVYLSDVVKPVQSVGPTKIERTNRQRSVTVTSNLSQGYSIGNVQQVIQAKIDKLNKAGVAVSWSGQADQMGTAFADIGQALLLSITLVFILMAMLFESVLSPLIIGLAVPQAMAGALLALTVTHLSMSIISLVGVIMLVGLVTKNAILMVDYTNTLRRENGMERRKALLQAGPTRLRPILMTTLAMVGGMMPTAIALSKGSEMRQPMAVTVIGGLIVSLFLSLLMVPTFYEIIDGFGEWFSNVKNRLLSGMKI